MIGELIDVGILHETLKEQEQIISRKDQVINQRDSIIKSLEIENIKLKDELLLVYREFFKRSEF